jgi:uncharacterized phiE125 gp8 family phage protein
MMLSPVLVTPPAVTPVSVEEARQHCRIDSYDEDVLLQMYVQAATAHLDGYTGILGRALITQTWQADFDAFCTRLDVPLGPNAVVTSVTYYDGYNAEQEADDTLYGVYTDARGAYVALKTGQSWPSVYDRADAVRVTWTAGYGAAAASVPAAIRAAILLMVEDMYANRGAKLDDPMPDNPTVDRLIRPFRRLSI